MERHHRAPVVTLFWSDPIAIGDVVLQGDPVQHARARRVEGGEGVRLIDGKGRVATGAIVSIGKDRLTVSIERITDVPKPIDLEIVVPVADKERMLFAAEKCAELQVTSWRPAYFARSRSVSPRGEGDKFGEKVRARMRAALEQSGGAWMPDIHGEAEVAEAFAGVPADWSRFILDASGTPLAGHIRTAPTSVAVGPEGGLEPAELASAEQNGWLPASLAATTLRFETAIVASAAVIRALQLRAGRT